MKKKLIAWLNVIISPCIIFIVYFSGHSIVGDILLPILGNILKPEIIQNISATSAKVAIDTAILNLIINIILLKILNLVKLTVKITNKDRTSELYIPINEKKTKTVEISIVVDYKFNWIKNTMRHLNGSALNIYIPMKIDYQIKNKKDFNGGSLLDSESNGIITLKLEDCLDIKEVDKQIFVLLEITATPEYLVNKSICTEFTSLKHANLAQKIILSIITTLFMDIELDKHDIRGRNT